MPTPLQRTRFVIHQPPGPYLFREEFPTAHSAGTLASYNAEPGPGSWAAVDTNGKLSISGGALTGVTGGAGNFDPSLVGQTPISRVPGRLLVASTTVTANRVQIGWLNQRILDPIQINPSRRGLLDLNGTALAAAQTASGSIAVGTIALSTTYQVAIAHRLSGMMYFIKGGAFTNWTLVWVDVGITNAVAYPAYCYLGTTTAFTCDYIRVHNSQVLAIPVASDGFSVPGTTDGLGHLEGQIGCYGSGGGDLTWVDIIGTGWNASGGLYLPGGGMGEEIAFVNTGVADVIASVKFNRSSDNGGVLVRCTADAGSYVKGVHNGTNAQLIKVVGGTPTTLVNAAATYVAGAEIRVICEGQKFRLYYNNALIGTEQTIADASLASGTRQGVVNVDGNNTFDDFTVYARGTGGEYAALDAF